MSDPVSKPDVDAGSSTSSNQQPKLNTNTNTNTTKPESKGFTNPALQAMGIKRLRLPSRNWTIFLSVVSVALGGIAYDKYEQSQIRKHYVEEVKPYSEVILPSDYKPRKLRIYVVPPPSDYLAEGLRYFRKYVKPILNSAGLDFEIYTEERQGDIRFAVAEEIRKIRRNKAGINDDVDNNNDFEDEIPKEKDEVKDSLLKMGSVPIPKINPIIEEKQNKFENNLHPDKKVSELYTTKDLLGINFTKFPFLGLNFEHEIDPKIKYQDSEVEDIRDAGGIICVGRGAYKEYIHGVHEGLLGPLTKPIKEEYDLIEYNIQPEKEDDKKKLNSDVDGSLKHPDQIEREREEAKEAAKKAEEKAKEKEKENEQKKKEIPPVTKPYILPKQYKEQALAPELELQDLNNLKDSNGIPYFFIQPVTVIRNYNMLGFFNTPQRVYRFYNKRDQAKTISETTANVVKRQYRPMKLEDLDRCIEEESDWPSKWVQTGKDRQNEWCREFSGDSRVVEILSVYEDGDDKSK